MKAFIRPKALIAVAVIGGLTAILFAEPTWWVQRGVRDPNKEPSDFAVLNQGQLKNLVRAARDELNTNLPGGAGSAINNLVDEWTTPTADTKDFAAVNAGQLKAVAKLFYDRLITEGRAVSYPWTTDTSDDSDFAIVNIGQAKRVFGFVVGEDTDGDGLSDEMETLLHTSPSNSDTDGDGLSDLAEIQSGSDPLNSLGDAVAASLMLQVLTPLEGGAH